MERGSGARRCPYPERQTWQNNTAPLLPAPREEMMGLKERKRAPLLTTACPKEPAEDFAKGPTGASYRSQLLPLHPGSPKSQASVLPCKTRGPRKQLGAVTLLAIQCSSSFPVYRSSSGLYHSHTLAPKDSPVA